MSVSYDLFHVFHLGCLHPVNRSISDSVIRYLIPTANSQSPIADNRIYYNDYVYIQKKTARKLFLKSSNSPHTYFSKLLNTKL